MELHGITNSTCSGLPPNLRIHGKSGNAISNQEKKKDFSKNQGNFKFCIVAVQSNDFLPTQSQIQLSVTITKFYLFIYHSVLCSLY